MKHGKKFLLFGLTLMALQCYLISLEKEDVSVPAEPVKLRRCQSVVPPLDPFADGIGTPPRCLQPNPYRENE